MKDAQVIAQVMALHRKVSRKRIVSSARLAGRTLIVLALTLGYVVLGIGLGGAFIYRGERLYYVQDPYRIAYRYAAQLCYAIAGVFFGFWLPIWRRVEPEGARLQPQEQPKLFETINKVAFLVGQRMPDEIYLTSKVNASIAWKWGLTGLCKPRMFIGLPLFQLHTVSQFEAIVAHEFGHLRRADLHIAVWVHRIEAWIEHTIDSMSTGRPPDLHPIRWKAQIFQFPFVWYGRLFMRAAQPLSRALEIAADRVAAIAIGPEHLAEVLRDHERNGKAYAKYFCGDVIPVVEMGFRPPFLEGLARCLDFAGERTGEADARDPDDHHPPLTERLAAIEDLPSGKFRDDSPALSLLNNVPELETRVLLCAADDQTKPLKPISWKETGERAVVPYWRWRCRVNQGALGGLTLGSLPRAVARLDALADKTFFGWLAPLSMARADAKQVLVAALGCALDRAGWQIDHGPGYLWMRRGEAQINPKEWIERMTSPEFTEERWQETLTRFQLDPDMSLEHVSD